MPNSNTSPTPTRAPRLIQPVEHTNLDRKAHEILKSLIVGRQLAPGEKIPQEKLAAELGISRTPLVNALKLLEKENLVEARPRRGFYVRTFRTREMIAVFELREVLEGLAARKAAEVITPAQVERLRRFFSAFSLKKPVADLAAYAQEDEAFHSFLIGIAGHDFLREILDSHDVVHASYQTTAAGGLMRPPAETIGEHRALIDAVCARDAVQAERLMRLHLANTIAALQQKLAAETRDDPVPRPASE